MINHCPTCNAQMEWRTCPDCDGTGLINGGPDTTCPTCKGEGEYEICPACNPDEENT